MQDATAVLRVGDYERAKEFYIEKLGFEVKEEGGDPAGFGIFRRDKAQVFLESWQGAEAPYDRWRVYIHVDDIESYAQEFREKGITFSHEVTTTEYGMREFEIADPDGNVVCFGMDIG